VLISLTRDGFPVSAKLDLTTGVPDTQTARDQVAAWQRQLTPAPIPIWKAQRMVSKTLEHGGYRWMVKLPSEVQIGDTAVEFFAHTDEYHQREYPAGKETIDLTKIGALTTYSQRRPYNYYAADSSDMCERGPCYCTLAQPNHPKPPILDIMCWNNAFDAHAFVSAMNRLRAFARGEADKDADWRNFQQKAAAWRALPTKPPLSEEVRRHRILAENAFKEKQFDTAVEHYEEGLDIEPLWPQGHFNAALMYAELKHYTDAIQHMRFYVELVPEAPDVQEARDQIVIWQDKLKQQATTPAAK
jgi:tetratricopeptide (TPR) repeat protein